MSCHFSAPPTHAVDILPLYAMSFFHTAHRAAEESMPLATACLCMCARLLVWLATGLYGWLDAYLCVSYMADWMPICVCLIWLAGCLSVCLHARLCVS